MANKEEFDRIKAEYERRAKEEFHRVYSENKESIEEFRTYCESKGITITEDHVRCGFRIGVVVEYPNIVAQLGEDMRQDKEGLTSLDYLGDQYDVELFELGYFSSDRLKVMAHPRLRRGMAFPGMFNEALLNEIWKADHQKIERSIAMDTNRVRIDRDNAGILEEDFWYGGKFNQDVSQVKLGIVKLSIPLDIDKLMTQMLFSNNRSLLIKWAQQDNIKSFYALEVKDEDVKVSIDDKAYHPIRYFHAEYDLSLGFFRHLDGALQYYEAEDYAQVVANDFNFNEKGGNFIKAKSMKLFKLNGEISVELWQDLVGYFFWGNPLIHEYFEGKYPQPIEDSVAAIRNSAND